MKHFNKKREECQNKLFVRVSAEKSRLKARERTSAIWLIFIRQYHGFNLGDNTTKIDRFHQVTLKNDALKVRVLSERIHTDKRDIESKKLLAPNLWTLSCASQS